MGILGKHLLTTFLIVIVLSLSSSCTNGLHEDNYMQEEYGYDFRSYPSYFRPFESLRFDSSVKNESRFSDFSRRLAASVKTVNVLSFGAKGDGKSDDTKVITKINRYQLLVDLFWFMCLLPFQWINGYYEGFFFLYFLYNIYIEKGYSN